MYTKEDLAERVLRKLRVIDASEAQADIDSDILSIVTTAYGDKWEEWSAHGKELTYWAMNEIPRPVMSVLTDLIALEVQDYFGQPMSPDDKEAREQVLLRRLRTHVQIGSSGRPVVGKYF